MRIRTIKPEFFNHEGIYDLEESSELPVRLAFAGLWCAADKEGRFKWEPRRLGVQILPYDKIDFARVLDALMTRGFVRKYCVENKEYGVIPSFKSHQVINNRERESELPEPLQYMDFDACATREGREDHASKEEGKGRERKGRERPQAVQTFPTLDQVQEFIQTIPGIPDSEAIAIHGKWEGNGFTVNGKKIKDWKATIRNWNARGFLDYQKAGYKPPVANGHGAFIKDFKDRAQYEEWTDEKGQAWMKVGESALKKA